MPKKNVGTLAGWLILVGCGALGILLSSCSMFNYEPVQMVPVSIPGAEYVGMETCATCHDQEYQYFRLSSHGARTLKVKDGDESKYGEGCETCHGPGSLHVAGRGDKSKIIRGGDGQTCFNCHLDVKGKFQLQFHHPVPEGVVKCMDCHDLHGRDARSTVIADLRGGMDQKCFKCHKEKRGPFVFEHEAMREGCTMCHSPHGAVYDKLLVAGKSTLCLRCHWEVTFDQTSGKLGDAGLHGGQFIGRGVECIDHHTAPHGSNISNRFLR
jgi:predicted CXXCH cytochrome family protein